MVFVLAATLHSNFTRSFNNTNSQETRIKIEIYFTCINYHLTRKHSQKYFCIFKRIISIKIQNYYTRPGKRVRIWMIHRRNTRFYNNHTIRINTKKNQVCTVSQITLYLFVSYQYTVRIVSIYYFAYLYYGITVHIDSLSVLLIPMYVILLTVY